MPIAMTNGTTYENSLDMLFAKDMPSREETQGKMPSVPEPNRLPDPNLAPMSEEDQLHPNQPMDMHKTPPTDFEAVMKGLGEISDQETFKGPGYQRSQRYFQNVRSEDDTLPPNARPTSEETPPEKSTYEKITEALSKIDIHPSFAPRPEVFAELPWKEKLGSIIATTFMAMGPGRGVKGPGTPGATPLKFWTESLAELDKIEHPVINTLRTAEKEGSQTAANLLETYKKIDDPVVRAEFSKIVKDKINSVSEGGENAPSDITNPTIRGMKEGSDWSEVITKPDGTKETVYDTAKIERLRNLRDNGLTFTEIGEKMGVSRNSVNSMLRRLKTMDAEEVTPSEAKPNSPWRPTEDKALTNWYNDPNSDLVEPPALLKHRSEGSINARIKQLGLEKAAEETSSQPFVPKGAVSAPEKGSGSGGPVNTELEGKSGIRTPKGLNDPEFRALQAMRSMPGNQNISPENFGKNMATDIIRNNLTGTGKLTTEEVTALVNKHGPAFEEFSLSNPQSRGTSASEFSRYMEKSRPLINELEALERYKMDKYDKAVADQKKRKDNIRPVK